MSQEKLLCGLWWSWLLSATLWSVSQWPTSALKKNMLLLAWHSHGSWPWLVLHPLCLDGPGTVCFSVCTDTNIVQIICTIKHLRDYFYLLATHLHVRTCSNKYHMWWCWWINIVCVNAGTSQRECSVPVGLTTTLPSLRSTTPHSSSICLSSISLSPSSSFSSATVACSALCER